MTETPSREHRPEPLWAQAAELISEQITRDGLTPGSRLPTERDLCARFGISRVTLRKALGHLLDRGLVTSSHGRGWFVATPSTVREWPNDLESFTTTARRKGLVARSEVLEQLVRPATLDEADALAVPAGTPLLVLERVRFLGDVRMALDHAVLPAALAPGLADVDFTAASLFEELTARGVVLDRSETAIESRIAGEALAAKLHLSAGEPILLLDQTIYDADNRPILLSTVEYSGDRYRLRTTFRPR
ncbi:GntR family transcriptional regulator [Kribbella sandramycini]|uniref:GntR family transcriptional regulator n=1 Tax=Kribbella sandramycini TaxID=60450 RepID=A0A7Y4L7W1_9ACTN|nr:GntR family transcriptional regulator [Kribbella sandramycini]MBB6567073.1 GntR family transcriptional regulator [Kribbella sandramycini]NOL44791.1 GntR family transcriptional regulator [Kribbella sandramycini]